MNVSVYARVHVHDLRLCGMNNNTSRQLPFVYLSFEVTAHCNHHAGLLRVCMGTCACVLCPYVHK